MRQFIIITFIVVFAFSLTSLSLARDPSLTSGGSETQYIYEGQRDITVWCQQPNFLNGIASSIDPDPAIYDAESVDDFMSDTDYAITSIEWWGVNYTPGCIDYFIITFYGNVGDCSGPDDANIISQQMIFAFNETLVADADYQYFASLVPVLMDAGQWYWVSIVAVMDFTVCGQWFWTTGEPAWNCNPMLRSNYFGIPTWTAIYPDLLPDNPEFEALAFCLYSDETVATETSSWGNIKAIYK